MVIVGFVIGLLIIFLSLGIEGITGVNVENVILWLIPTLLVLAGILNLYYEYYLKCHPEYCQNNSQNTESTSRLQITENDD